MNSTLTPVQDLIDRLRRPIPDLSTLIGLLSSPLDCIGLLPPRFRRYKFTTLPDASVNIHKHIPSIQRVLLEYIVPTWDTSLAEENANQLLEQYFCPDSFSFALSIAGGVALQGYFTILSQPLKSYSLHLLTRLTTEYPIDRLHSVIFTRDAYNQSSERMLVWEDCVRNIVTIPGKVGNAVTGKTEPWPLLEHTVYYNNLCVRCEHLISSLSKKKTEDAVLSVSYILAKLVNLGVFPSAPPEWQPSFFKTTLPTIRTRLSAENTAAYSAFWSSLYLALPSSLTVRSILTSLLASLPPLEHAMAGTPFQRALVRRDARLLNEITGHLTPETNELWETALAIILGKDWGIGQARLFVCWLSGGSHNGRVVDKVIDTLVNNILEVWSSADHIKHSLLSRHKYITSLLLIAVSYLPPSSQSIQSLAFSPSFISGIGTYIGHLDVSVRRCGMLVAEVVAQLSGKKLDFGDWDGDDSGKPWAREVRELIKNRDVDSDLSTINTIQSEVIRVEEAPSSPGDKSSRDLIDEPATAYDSDDSITGYASPSSSRSVSPTPSELDAIERDPSLNVGVKKAVRPVYLFQLGEMLRSTGGAKSNDDPHDADKIEMALNYAEELIRKKRGYGTELDENAINLVYGLLGLQHNYNLQGFETNRQNALSALVACSPRKAAPALIEEFFKNQYSTSQRYVALNALALGSREMAALPLPPSNISIDRISFPSKRLPLQLHQRYLASGEHNIVPLIMDSISNNVIEKGKNAFSDKAPEIMRERRLRVQKPPGITQVSLTSAPPSAHRLPQYTPFTEVATEYFIAPLINRFWLFLRDEQAREERTAHRTGRQKYHGAGTGLVLNPVVLAHFLRTLAILVHASQNAPEWLAIIAPDALELAVTIGTKPVSHIETDNDEREDEDNNSQGKKEASVLTSALELSMIVLDGCLDLDGGRVIGLEHTTLLLGAGELAGRILSDLERGLRVQGGGGEHETKLSRAAAGVLLKVDELTSKWRRSMLDTR